MTPEAQRMLDSVKRHMFQSDVTGRVQTQNASVFSVLCDLYVNVQGLQMAPSVEVRARLEAAARASLSIVLNKLFGTTPADLADFDVALRRYVQEQVSLRNNTPATPQ